MPDSASVAENETVTSPLYQPAPFAARSAEAVTVGAVLSRRTVTEPVPVFPALSLAVEVLLTPAAGVSAVTESEAGLGNPAATPEPKSVADQLMLTGSLCQPAALAAGDTAAVTTGAVESLSTVYDAV